MTALILAATWSLLRARRSLRPYAWIAAAGVLTGLATLTHVKQLRRDGAAWRTRAGGCGAGGWRPWHWWSRLLLTLTPWHDPQRVELHRFAPVTDETGITLVGTYNSASAVVRGRCRTSGASTTGSRGRALIDSAVGAPERARALLAAREPGADTTSAITRSPRWTWPTTTRSGCSSSRDRSRWHASAAAQGLPSDAARIGVLGFWIVCLLALAGAFYPRGPSRTALAVDRAAAADGTRASLFVNVETPRFREPVEPFLILSAACALSGRSRAPCRRLGSSAGPARTGGSQSGVDGSRRG